jgi:hypothetical protein
MAGASRFHSRLHVVRLTRRSNRCCCEHHDGVGDGLRYGTSEAGTIIVT